MAVKTFSTMVELQALIEPKITKALMTTSVILVKNLRDFISTQYYNDPYFYPNVYNRTFQFLDSASYQLIGKNISEIFIDTDSMTYKNGFDPEQVVDYAAQSMHGSELYQTDTEDFWSVFERYCEKNALNILKSELKKQGLDIL